MLQGVLVILEAAEDGRYLLLYGVKGVQAEQVGGHDHVAVSCCCGSRAGRLPVGKEDIHQRAVAHLLIVDPQGIHQDPLGIDQDLLLQCLREIAVLVADLVFVHIQREGAGRPGQHLDDGHLDQGFQPLVGVSGLENTLLDQRGDQRFAGFTGKLLLQKGLFEPFFTEEAHLGQQLADADAVVEVVGADEIPVAEDQLALALLALDRQRPRLPGGMDQLDDVDDRHVCQISGKGHGGLSFHGGYVALCSHHARVSCRYLMRCGMSAAAPRRFLRSSSYSE